MGQTYRHPEWKRLLDGIGPLLDRGETNFSYEVLGELAGVDIRTPRGRQQFYKFRAEMQQARRLWFENQPGYGYTVIEPQAHIKASQRRVKQGKRKVGLAKDIVDYVQDEKLTQEQRVTHVAFSAVLSELSKTFLSMSRKLATAASPKRIDAKPPKWEG
ncbi:MAG TPA: hypothetical protein VNW90_25410 [Acetobacteraceae bacterium]|jgi:hypothetical protein|nr:hypothetical protein [Acetobacteraceae bacterium]